MISPRTSSMVSHLTVDIEQGEEVGELQFLLRIRWITSVTLFPLLVTDPKLNCGFVKNRQLHLLFWCIVPPS